MVEARFWEVMGRAKGIVRYAAPEGCVDPDVGREATAALMSVPSVEVAAHVVRCFPCRAERIAASRCQARGGMVTPERVAEERQVVAGDGFPISEAGIEWVECAACAAEEIPAEAFRACAACGGFRAVRFSVGEVSAATVSLGQTPLPAIPPHLYFAEDVGGWRPR